MFGFQYPAVLWSLPLLAGFLIWIYLRRGRGKQVLVSSVLLLRGLRSPSSSRKRFVPPLRFFFELLIVAALIAALAGLFRQNKLTRYAVVIDNSLSMAARQSPDQEQISLLSAALQSADTLVGSLEDEAEIEIFQTSPEFLSLTDGLQDARKARAALHNVELAYADDNLQSIIDKLSLEDSFEKAFIFSDHPVIDSPLSMGAAQDRRIIIRDLRAQGAQSPRSNAALTDIGWRRNFDADGRQDLSVTLEAFSGSPLKGRVSISEVSSGKLPVELLPVESREVVLKAGGGETLVFSGLSPHVAALHVSFSETSGGRNDLINQDNQAWIAVEEGQERIIVVSDLPAENLGLKNIRNLKFESQKPETYQPVRSRGQETVIFHRFAPPHLPEVNSLFVMPPASGGWLEVGPEISPVDITGWQAVHPLLSYLNLEILSLKSCRSFILPSWGRELIASNAGPVAFAGELGGRRYVATAFELFPFEGRKSALLSIFTLNILKWLTSLGSGAGYRAANSLLETEDGREIPVFMDGEELRPAGTANLDKEKPAGRKNYLLARPGLVFSRSSGKYTPLTAVNFFSQAESNLLQVQPVKLSAKSSAQSGLTGREDLSGKLSRLLLFVLFADLAFALFRAARSRRAAA